MKNCANCNKNVTFLVKVLDYGRHLIVKCPACGSFAEFTVGGLSRGELEKMISSMTGALPTKSGAIMQIEEKKEKRMENTAGNMIGGVETSNPVNHLGGIGAAVEALRAGRRVARHGWNGRGQYLELQMPDLNSKMTLPYVYICTVQGDFVPWLCSQTDLLATDWLELV